ncbi:MAG TPA: hypothetical protein VGK41_01225 [Solirubrobacterales bacterium]
MKAIQLQYDDSVSERLIEQDLIELFAASRRPLPTVGLPSDGSVDGLWSLLPKDGIPVAAAAGGDPAPGPLYLSDGTTSTITTVKHEDGKFQFDQADRMVVQTGATTQLLYANDKETSLLVPMEPFSTDGSGIAGGVALGTPVHGVVVMGQEFPVAGGTVTMVVVDNVVSAQFTPD